MSEEASSDQTVWNLSRKNYNDKSNIFTELLSTYPRIENLDLSENNLTSLPLDLSGFTRWHVWDIRSNPFENFDDIVLALSTLPSLLDLKINLTDETQVKLILSQLTNLELLNGKSTKEEAIGTTGMIDWNDEETKGICLQNEISSFNEIFKKVSEKLKHSDAKDNFKEEFQALIKSEISKINSSVDAVPNYIYAASVLESQWSVYSFFNEKFFAFWNGKDSAAASLGGWISENIMKSYLWLIKIIYKLYPMINEKTQIWKGQLEEAMKSNQFVSSEINDYEDKFRQMSRDKDALIVQYQEQVKMWQGRIDNLENENRVMTEKMLKNAKEIINYNSNWNINLSNNESGVNNHNACVNANANANVNNSYSLNRKQSKDKLTSQKQAIQANYNNNNPNQSMTGNNNPTPISPPVCTRVFTIKMMKDVINDIYSSKADFDKKSDDNKLPRETLEQHMYTYLNQKYGWKQIIIEWASNIINGIKVFSSEDSEILVFGKILRNEMEEDSRFMYTKLRQKMTEFIIYHLKTKYPRKRIQEIQDMKEQRLNGVISEDEWKKIINYWYESPDSNYWENKIIDVIQRKYLKSKFDTDKKLTREEIITLSQTKEEYSIPFKDWVKVLHEFQVKMKENYSRNFVILFKRFDSDNNGIINEEDFINMVYCLNCYGERVKENVVRLLTMVDPNNNKQITFSECCAVFTNEMWYDEHGGCWGSLMDRICLDEKMGNII